MILSGYMASSSIQEVCYAVLDIIDVVMEGRRLPRQRRFRSHTSSEQAVAPFLAVDGYARQLGNLKSIEILNNS